MALRGLGASGVANPGEVTTMEFTPTQAGTFEINCGMGMMRPGYVIVTE